MTDRKKPGVAFWATVVVALLVAYPLSFGPWCWALSRNDGNQDSPVIPESFYAPVVWIWQHGPDSISRTIFWYANIRSEDQVFLFHDPKDGAVLIVRIPP